MEPRTEHWAAEKKPNEENKNEKEKTLPIQFAETNDQSEILKEN